MGLLYGRAGRLTAKNGGFRRGQAAENSMFDAVFQASLKNSPFAHGFVHMSERNASTTARAGNRRFWLLSALRAHTKAPYKIDFHRKTLRDAKGA